MLDNPAKIILRRVLRKGTKHEYLPIFLRYRKIWYATTIATLNAAGEPPDDMPFDQQILKYWPMVEAHSHKLLALCNTQVEDIAKLLKLFGLVIHPSGSSYKKATLYLISYDAFKASFQGKGILGYVMEFNVK